MWQAAALAQFAEFGIRRSTIDDVARRAGVSRVTVFRRFETKQRLVEVVVAREIRRAVAEFTRVWEGGESLEQRLLQGLSFSVQFCQAATRCSTDCCAVSQRSCCPC